MEPHLNENQLHDNICTYITCITCTQYHIISYHIISCW